MSLNKLFCFAASVLLIQTVQGCPCGPSSCNAGSAYGFGFGNGVSNLAANSINAGLFNGINGAGLGYNGYGSLELVSGSPTTPNGFSISAENLELVGPVAVTGSLPFAGAVAISGPVPVGGSAGVSYSTAPGAGLTSSGCGAGLAGTGYAGAGLANNAAYALGNNAGLSLGNSAAFSLGSNAFGLGNNAAYSLGNNVGYFLGSNALGLGNNLIGARSGCGCF